VRSIGTPDWARTINASHSHSIGFQINGEKETLIAAEITADKGAGEATEKPPLWRLEGTRQGSAHAGVTDDKCKDRKGKSKKYWVAAN
jgi:hypothetical protein